MIIAFAYSVYIIVIPDRISRKILQIYDFRNVNNDDAKYFKLYLLGFTLGNFCVSYITESVLIPAMTKCYSKRQIAKLRNLAKNNINYEYSLSQLQKIKNDKK